MSPYLEKGSLQNNVKDLETQSSWIIHVGPKSNEKCPIRDPPSRDTQGEEKATEDRGRDWSHAAPSQRSAWGPQKLEEASWDHPPLQPLKRVWPC